MKKLLRIDSSVRREGSSSTMLTDCFCEMWKIQNPDGEIIARHVGISPPKHPTHEYTIANYTIPEDRTASMREALLESDELIDELLSCDEFVFAVPMYNFSVPSTLKAYIDNIVRVGRTFTVSENGVFTGKLAGKKMTVISSRGAKYAPPSPLESFDLLTPYIRVVMGFMGLTDIEFVVAEDLDFSGPEQRESQLRNAKNTIKTMFV